MQNFRENPHILLKQCKLICISQNFFVPLHAKVRAGNKQANRKIMADIEKSHHFQDLARVRTKFEMDPFP